MKKNENKILTVSIIFNFIIQFALLYIFISHLIIEFFVAFIIAMFVGDMGMEALGFLGMLGCISNLVILIKIWKKKKIVYYILSIIMTIFEVIVLKNIVLVDSSLKDYLIYIVAFFILTQILYIIGLIKQYKINKKEKYDNEEK